MERCQAAAIVKNFIDKWILFKYCIVQNDNITICSCHWSLPFIFSTKILHYNVGIIWVKSSLLLQLEFNNARVPERWPPTHYYTKTKLFKNVLHIVDLLY